MTIDFDLLGSCATALVQRGSMQHKDLLSVLLFFQQLQSPPQTLSVAALASAVFGSLHNMANADLMRALRALGALKVTSKQGCGEGLDLDALGKELTARIDTLEVGGRFSCHLCLLSSVVLVFCASCHLWCLSSVVLVFCRVCLLHDLIISPQPREVAQLAPLVGRLRLGPVPTFDADHYQQRLAAHIDTLDAAPLGAVMLGLGSMGIDALANTGLQARMLEGVQYLRYKCVCCPVCIDCRVLWLLV